MTGSEGSFGLTEATVIFALALALAFAVERVLELLKTAYDLAESRWRWHDIWNREAQRIRDFAEQRLRAFTYLDPATMAGALSRFGETLLGPDAGNTGKVPILSADLVRVVWIRVFAKVFGMLLGILLANLFLVDLVAVWKNPVHPMAAFDVSHVWLTGITIGLGAGPVHKVITTIERQRDKRTSKKQQET